MGEQQGQRRGAEPRRFAESRTIDVRDEACLGFWSERLGVSREEIVRAVGEVGSNAMAVALKLEAPQGDRVAPPAHPPP